MILEITIIVATSIFTITNIVKIIKNIIEKNDEDITCISKCCNIKSE